nr:hypothetical protein Itr_chr11CG09010 [Ipomoea trifida]
MVAVARRQRCVSGGRLRLRFCMATFKRLTMSLHVSVKRLSKRDDDINAAVHLSSCLVRSFSQGLKGIGPDSLMPNRPVQCYLSALGVASGPTNYQAGPMKLGYKYLKTFAIKK